MRLVQFKAARNLHFTGIAGQAAAMRMPTLPRQAQLLKTTSAQIIAKSPMTHEF